MDHVKIINNITKCKDKIMGLDLSAKNTGICIIDPKRKMVDFHHIDTYFDQDGVNFRITYVWLYVYNLIQRYNVSKVCIEDYSFNKFGGSRATTVLGEINGGVKNINSFRPNIKFSTTTPTHAVKVLLGSLPKMERDAKKKIVLEAVAKILVDLKNLGWTITLHMQSLVDDDTDAFALAYQVIADGE